MRLVPDIITAARVMLAALLLFLPWEGGAFLLIYLICGLTDALDGWLARHLHAESESGARLDSAADFILFSVVIWRILPIAAPGTAVVVWVGAIGALRFWAAITAKRRFGKFGFLHTIGNKLTGFFLFLYPFTLAVTRSSAVMVFLCAVATLTAVEELIIELTATEWDPDRRSIFSKD